MSKNPFAEFLEREFTRIQFERRKRLTINEFAELLGFSPAAVSLWLNGDRKPDKFSVIQLAKILSPEIYDYFDLPRPDPLLVDIDREFPNLTASQQHAIHEQVGEYRMQNENENNQSGPKDP